MPTASRAPGCPPQKAPSLWRQWLSRTPSAHGLLLPLSRVACRPLYSIAANPFSAKSGLPFDGTCVSVNAGGPLPVPERKRAGTFSARPLSVTAERCWCGARRRIPARAAPRLENQRPSACAASHKSIHLGEGAMSGHKRIQIDTTSIGLDNAPLEAFTYALVKSGPDVAPEDVELGHVTSVEVMIQWGTTVLHVEHLTPPRTFYLGEGGTRSDCCDYHVPAERLGLGRAPLVVVDGDTLNLVV